MFKNFKLGIKLGLGFGVILLLTITIAAIGYLQQGKVSARIVKTEKINQIIDYTKTTRINALKFMRELDDKYKDVVRENLDNTIAKANEVLPTFSSKDDIENTKNIIEAATNYDDTFFNSYVAAHDKGVENKRNLSEIGRNVESHLYQVIDDLFMDYQTLMLEGATTEIYEDKVSKMIDGHDVIKQFLIARRHEKNLIMTSDLSYIDKINKPLEIAKTRVIDLRERYDNENHIKAANELLDLFQKYNTSIEAIKNVVQKQEIANLTLVENGEKVAEAVDILLTGQKTKTQSQLRQSELIFIWGSLIIVALGIICAFLITKGIVGPISRFSEKILDVRQSNDFSERVIIESQDEIGLTGIAFNELIESVQAAIEDAIAAVSNVAAGSFDQKVVVEVSGDLDKLKQGINQSVDNMQVTINALYELMEAMSEGDFAKRIDVNLQGEYKRSADAAVDSMSSLDSAITEINEVMQTVANGKFDNRITIDLPGDLGVLKNNLNKSLDVVKNGIEDTSRITVALSKGDLKQRVEADHPGQFGVLKTALNEAMDNIADVVNNIAEASDIVSSASNEMADGNADMSKRTEEQASSLEETASSMEELTSTVKQNADNAGQANQLAVSARDTANHGGSIVNEAITAMAEINSSSSKISDIIGVIDEIAFQTNLLALNASVEAARAGEQGRGFAVVATEVRNLAQRSATAAKEIKELIQDSVGKVKVGSDLVEKSGETLDEIVDGVKKVGDMIAEIAAASHEQTAGISQVNQALADMDDITQRNAALAEEASANSENLSSQAQTMSEQVGFFDLGNATGSKNKTNMFQRAATKKAIYNKTTSSNAIPKAQQQEVKSELVTQKPAKKTPTTKPKLDTKVTTPPHDDEWEEF